MLPRKFSIIFALWLCTSAAADEQNIQIKNSVDGCMKITGHSLAQENEPVILSLKLDAPANNANCPCKSSLIQYSASQIIDGQTSPLLEGNFSILGIKQIELPIAAQQRLAFTGHIFLFE